jgi:hypothetical protein
MQSPQRSRFHQLTGSGWSLFPDGAYSEIDGQNSLAWRTDVWQAVETHTIGIPYFHGMTVQMPYVKLRSLSTGREVWFANFHNPATTRQHGNNAHWRAVAVGREITLANQLGADGTPVVFTGDMNDREKFFCPITASTDLHSASGGSTGAGCAPARPLLIDWIVGTSQIGFSDYRIVSSSHKVSDHRLVTAQATLQQDEARTDFGLGDVSLPDLKQGAASGLDPWAPGNVRIRWTYELLDQADLDVIGFQELGPAQLSGFRRLADRTWRVFPGGRGAHDATPSSIAWRTSEWQLLKAKTLRVRAGKHAHARIPYVLLRNRTTGEDMWVVNTYNPVRTVTEATGPWADAADAAVVAKTDALRRTGTPVVVTGGLNENGAAFCSLSRKHSLVVPNVSKTASCKPGAEVGDQIFATRGIELRNFNVTRNSLVRKATDAPLVTVDAQVDDGK